jgi:hypothetical protein
VILLQNFNAICCLVTNCYLSLELDTLVWRLICSLLQYWSGAIINTGGKGQFEAMTASLHELLANDCLCFSFLMYCIFVCDDYCACVDIVACSGSY